MQLFPMLFGGAASATAGAAATAGATATLAAPAFSLTSLLQGTMTVLGIGAELAAGAADAQQADLAALDASREKDLENLQGVERRASIKRDMMDALGAQDVAYAASGVDLSFGTAAQARKDAYREADTALTANEGTTMVRTARLTERAANLRASAKRARLGSALNAAMAGTKTLLSFRDR